MFKKSTATPATIVLFFIVSLTGVALFFHLKPNWVHKAHEWIGLGFIVIAFWHAAIHWKSINIYMHRRASVRLMVVLFFAGFLFIYNTATSQNTKPRIVLDVLTQQSIQKIACGFDIPLSTTLALLEAHGIEAQATTHLIEAASKANQHPFFVLSLIARHASQQINKSQ